MRYSWANVKQYTLSFVSVLITRVRVNAFFFAFSVVKSLDIYPQRILCHFCKLLSYLLFSTMRYGDVVFLSMWFTVVIISVDRNDDKTAADYKVAGGSVLHLVLALRGGTRC